MESYVNKLPSREPSAAYHYLFILFPLDSVILTRVQVLFLAVYCLREFHFLSTLSTTSTTS